MSVLVRALGLLAAAAADLVLSNNILLTVVTISTSHKLTAPVVYEQ